MRKLVLVAALATVGLQASGQIGGRRTFSFLELPASAKLAAIGGVNVTSPGSDVLMTFSNPALLNQEMDGRAVFNHGWYLGDVRQNTLGYAFNSERAGRWMAGLQYINFGEMTETDPSGTELGKFRASDYAFQLSHARTQENITFGATAKLAVSSIAGQSALGVLTDIGGVFRHPSQDLQVGLVLRNVGVQLKTFDGGDRQPMPFDAQLGVSYKLEHMPLRLSVTAHRLYQWDIVYLDPNKKTQQLDANNNEVREKKTFGDQLLRHFVIGTEFLLTKNLHIRAGYHHLRRRELRMEEKAGGAGFSFGGHVRIKSFELGFTKAYYHVAGSTTYLQVSANIGSLFSKPKDDQTVWPQEGQ